MARVTMLLTPPPIARVFHIPEVLVDAGDVEDVELAACRMFLGWQAHHPDFTASLRIEGMPHEQKALQRALFSKLVARWAERLHTL